MVIFSYTYILPSCTALSVKIERTRQSLHCGTRYLTAVQAHPTAQVPRSGGERFRGARFDPWAILAYWCTLLQALLDRALALWLC